MKITIGTEAMKQHILEMYPYTGQVIHGNGYLVVAQDEEDTLLGFLWAFRREIEAPVYGLVEDFINVVEVFGEENKGKGIGSLLVQKCIEKAGEDASYQVRAYCDINNSASHKLWAKNKFGISPAKDMSGRILGSFVTYIIQ